MRPGPRSAIRVQRAEDSTFSALSNDLTRDPSVSFAAKGFALWLFGLPHWEHDAISCDTDVARRAGLHLRTVQTYLGQLQTAGFARCDDDGWTLTDERAMLRSPRKIRGDEERSPRILYGDLRESFAEIDDASLYKNNIEQQHVVGNTQPTCVVPDDERIFDAWVKSPTLVGRPARRGPVLTPKRRALIRRHLAEGYDVETLIAAVQGWTRSEFHRGRNEHGKTYDALELLLRDAKHVDDMAAAWRGTDASVGAMTDAEMQARTLGAMTGADVSTESAATARIEWDALIGAMRDLTAGLADESLHDDFVAIRTRLREEFRLWRAGTGRAPVNGWRDILARIPVVKVPTEPEPVSELAIMEAEAAAAAAMAALDGPIHRQPVETQRAVGALVDHARALKSQRRARAAWDAWAASHPDELSRASEWMHIRSGMAGYLEPRKESA